jgi:hypothetical protein
MKISALSILACCLIGGTAFAQTASTPAAKTGVSAQAAAVHAMCKDGTSFDGANMRGACSGHGGVDKKASSAASASTAASATTASSASVKAANDAAVSTMPAAGGGAGKVWVNTSSKVYHCANDKYYGKTKKGEYMTEADAKSKGFHVSHGKSCAA